MIDQKHHKKHQQLLNECRKDGLKFITGAMIALFAILLPLTWGVNDKQTAPESEIETAGISEMEFPFAIKSDTKRCEGEIAQELRHLIDGTQDELGFGYLMLQSRCDYEIERVKRALEEKNKNWSPGQLTEDGSQQLMPPISDQIVDSHERFKEVSAAYGIDASKIWTVEHHYGIKEGVILCITIAETSGGRRGYGQTNPGNVGNNDRGDRVKFAFFETGLESIGQTLTNKYLGNKKTLGCLSNAGSCKENNDNGKRYATSEGNWERNMSACLGTIYGSIDPSTFNIRR